MMERIYTPAPRTGSPAVDEGRDNDFAMQVASGWPIEMLVARLEQVAREPRRFDRASIRAITLAGANRLRSLRTVLFSQGWSE